MNPFYKLKPKIKKVGNRFHVISQKNGSRRIVAKASTFNKAVEQAVTIYRTRIYGRALRYEKLRRDGVPQAQ